MPLRPVLEEVVGLSRSNYLNGITGSPRLGKCSPRVVTCCLHGCSCLGTHKVVTSGSGIRFTSLATSSVRGRLRGLSILAFRIASHYGLHYHCYTCKSLCRKCSREGKRSVSFKMTRGVLRCLCSV